MIQIDCFPKIQCRRRRLSECGAIMAQGREKVICREEYVEEKKKRNRKAGSSRVLIAL